MLGLGINAQLVLYAGYALVFVATYFIANTLFKEEQSRLAEEGLDANKDRKPPDFLVKITQPVFRQYVVPFVRGKKFWDEKRRVYKQKLVSAGLKNDFTPDEFIAYKFTLTVFFPVVLFLIHTFDFLEIGGIWIVASFILGWFYPDFWVHRRTQARHQEIRVAMPFIVDLLALCTGAGMELLGAIGKVIEKANNNALIDEFEQIFKEINVGSSRQQALRQMAERVNMTEINSFVAILISSDQMGSPISRTLRQQSDQVRNERFVRAEKAGAAAAQKLMIPTMICIVPAVVLMIFGPYLLSFIYGDGAGF